MIIIIPYPVIDSNDSMYAALTHLLALKSFKLVKRKTANKCPLVKQKNASEAALQNFMFDITHSYDSFAFIVFLKLFVEFDSLNR